MLGVEFACELTHGFSGIYHQLLRTGDLILELFGVAAGFPLQGEQPELKAHEGLGDFILKCLADFRPFRFLRGEHLVRQLPQAGLPPE